MLCTSLALIAKTLPTPLSVSVLQSGFVLNVRFFSICLSIQSHTYLSVCPTNMPGTVLGTRE